ncbi:MAG: hypothetical protein Q9208_004180 [Pyrenodesmia sp. 3 TL-2023]
MRSAACICAYVESVSILYDDIQYSETFTVYCSLFDVIEGSLLANAFALDADGRTVAIIRGIDFKIIGISSFQKLVGTRTAAPAVELQEDLNESSETASPSPQAASTPATSSGSKSPVDDHTTPNHQDVVKNLPTLLGEITSLTTRDLDLNSPLSNLGVDSLMRIELAGKLRRVFAGQTMDHDQIAEMDTIQGMVNGASSTLDAYAQYTAPQQLNSTPLPKAWMPSSQKPVLKSVAATSVRISEGRWPFGGVVAFEARRQLVQRGTKVQGIILIDAPYPVNHQPLPQRIIHHAVVSGSPSNTPKSATNETLLHEFRYHADILVAYHRPSPPTNKSAQRPILKTVILHSEAILDVQKLCGVHYDWPSSQAHRKPAVEKWKTIEQCDVVEVLPIPGNHFEAFMPGNIPAISKQLRRACQILDTAS